MASVEKIVAKVKAGFLQKSIEEIKWVYTLLQQDKWQIISYTALVLISMGISLSITLQSKSLVDSLVSGSWMIVVQITVYYICIGTLNVALSMIIQRMSARLSAKVKTELSVASFNQVLSADWESVAKLHSGDIMARMQEDIGVVAGSTVGWIPSIISQLAQIVIAALCIVYYDFSMLFVILLVTPIIFFSSRIFLSRMYDSNMRQRQISSTIMSMYKESFQHLQSIKSFGLLSIFDSKMNQMQNKRQLIDMEVNKYSIASWGVMYIGGQIAALICLGWSIYHVYQGKISLGTMALLIVLASSVATAFKSFIQLIPTAVGTISSAERLRTILNLPEEEIPTSIEYQRLFELSKNQGISVHISHMDFSYQNGQTVFEDVSCHIERGEIVAFVGPSGEGKTTLLRILLGIVRAHGSITLSSGTLTLPISAAARGLISYVPQGNTMMNGTIAENLRLLKPDATDDEIIQALKDACAYEFVEKLPNGINHIIGESGIGFSEGQNQRLAIARHTPLLLLDEATSALDVATERRVLANLMSGKNRRTCILTTHRPSVLTMCDRVYRIAERSIRAINESEIEQLMNEF